MLRINPVARAVASITVLGLAYAFPANAGGEESANRPGVFECAARPAHFDYQNYALDGVATIDGAADVLAIVPTKVWAGGAAFDLMRSAKDENFVRLLFQSDPLPSRKVKVSVHEAGSQTGIRVGEFTRVKRVPFVITLDDAGATLVGLGKEKLNIKMTTFRPTVGRAVCFSSTAVFDGLMMPVAEKKLPN